MSDQSLVGPSWEYTFEGGFIGRSNGSHSGNEFMRLMIGYDQRYKTNKAFCRAWLRAHGIKLAHPDDGWVDRKNNSFMPAYPLFDDYPREGDKIALGDASSDGPLLGHFRIVKITGVRKGVLSGHNHYQFEVTQDVMDVPPCRVWQDHESLEWRAEKVDS